MGIIFLLVLIVGNGLLAMAEISLVTAKRNRLTRLADEGDVRARAALELSSNPTRFLSTIQIGITGIGILNGIVGQAVLSETVQGWLEKIGLSEKVSGPLATILVVAIITYFSIVIGELVPKRIGQSNAEGIARFVARPIALLATLSRPFVHILAWSTDAVIKIFGGKVTSHDELTEDDIHAVLEQGSQSGLIEKEEHTMVSKILHLDKQHVSSIMTPRSEIIYLNESSYSKESILEAIESGHSHFPVCDGGIDHLLGFVSARKMLEQILMHENFSLQSSLHEPIYIPESLHVMNLLQQFRSSSLRMAFVIDEYGGLLGLITVHDLLEAVAGDFSALDPEEEMMVQRTDGSWLLEGFMPVGELKRALALSNLPEEEKGQYNTISGMILLLLGRLATTTDSVIWGDWTFEVIDMDGNRIDKVLATKRDKQEDSTEESS